MVKRKEETIKNILNTDADQPLGGRMLFSTKFVSSSELRGNSVLDIGCGYGWFERYALDQNVASIVGLEISEEDLTTIRASVVDARAKYQVAGATDLPFVDNSFDLVTSWEVLEHIPKASEAAMFNEVARVLKPGGHFYLSTPFRSLSSMVLDPAWWLIGHRHYSASHLQNYCRSAGFKADIITSRGRQFDVIGSLNMYISKWLFHRPPFFEKFFQNKSNQEYQSVNGYATIFMKATKL